MLAQVGKITSDYLFVGKITFLSGRLPLITFLPFYREDYLFVGKIAPIAPNVGKIAPIAPNVGKSGTFMFLNPKQNGIVSNQHQARQLTSDTYTVNGVHLVGLGNGPCRRLLRSGS